MSGSLWLWMALAVTVFWGVGVYNRLMRMQVRAMAALRSVEIYMRRCCKLMDGQASHVMDRPAFDQVGASEVQVASWAHVVQSTHGLHQTLAETKGTPLANQSITRVARAFEEAQDAWQQWCDAQSASDADTNALRMQWDDATLKVHAARQGLNQILRKYNEAIGQFPARLLVRLMGFKPAGLM